MSHNHVPRLMNEVEALKQLVTKLIWTLNDKFPNQTPRDSSVDAFVESCEEQILGRVYEINIPEDVLKIGTDSETGDVKILPSKAGDPVIVTGVVSSKAEEKIDFDESQHMILSGISLSHADFTALLKLLRQYLEKKYDTIASEIPSTITNDLSTFETTLHIPRDPTTNSIWNIHHQAQRAEFHGKIGSCIVYLQKCICEEDSHSDDKFCPRNIPDDEKASEASDDDSEEETPAQKAEREAREKAEHEKAMVEKRNKAIAGINAMQGVHELKAHIQTLTTRVETAKRQGADLKSERFGTIFIGGPGTGKTTAARHYAKLLHALGIVGGESFKETNAVLLCDGGIDRTMRYIQEVCSEKAGVFFIDGAHFFYSPDHYRGKRVLDFLFEEIERQRGKVVVIMAGQEEGMRKVMGHYGDVRGVLPNVLNFKDFEDTELRSILWEGLKKNFKGKGELEVEGGERGLYMRIAARRLGQGREATGFGNARAVENLCAKIWERQAARLEKRRIEAVEKKLEDEALAKEAKAAEEKVGDEKSKEELEVVSHLPEETEEKFAARLATLKRDKEISEKKENNDAEAKQGEVKDGEVKSNPKKEEEEPPIERENYKLTKEDILGPCPTDSVLSSPAWLSLQNLTGLSCVKSSILSLLSLIKTNHQRELEDKPLLKIPLNRLFLGPPGTGKTLVVHLYAQLLTEIGALSKGEVIIRTPSDLIGKYIGHSEANTKAVLNAARGNVLVIDEAHMIYSADGDKTGSKTDSFRRGIVDTLVGEIQSEPGEDRCVLLVGYEEPMTEMLQNSNPGLSRRFPLSNAFCFLNFEIEELGSILRSKLKENMLEASESAIKVAMDVLEKASSRVNFGNGGEVENLISKAKMNYQKRTSVLAVDDRPQQWVFEPEDFDPEYDRGESATENLRKLFADVIGCEKVIKKLEQYQRVSLTLKKKNMDPRPYIPTNFVFKGPPGTGKTTTARKIAQVYYDMGFLSEASVIECSASDLVGKYVGHSGPKTRKLFERAIGKVLFIDEAYRLANGSGSSTSCGTGSFNSEVVAELVDLLTKPAYQGKLVIILAGYEAEINKLLDMNPGLASRFPEEIHFRPLNPSHCLDVLRMKLKGAGIVSKVLEDKEPGLYDKLIMRIRVLARTKGWGNARDMETLAKAIARDVFVCGEEEGEGGELSCSGEMMISAFEGMLRERRARTAIKSS